MRALGAALGLVLVLGVAGCSVVPTTPAPHILADVPTAWSVTQDTTSRRSPDLSAWWLQFDDALLAQLVGQAMKANTDVNAGQAALAQARALRDVSAAALRPTLDASASAQRSSNVALGGPRTTVNSFQTGLDASWELDVFGAKRSALDVAEATVRVSAAHLGDVQVSIAAEVALDYITLRSAQARLDIATRNLASQNETLQITQWRLQAGLVTSLEAEQALSAVEQTGALVPALQTGIAQASHALSVLTGSPPTTLSAMLAITGPVPRASDDLSWRLPAETLRQRADVRAAEQQVEAAAARVNQAEAARLPQFTIGGSLGLSALTLATLTHGASVVGAMAASVQLPVFDGGAARAQVSAQRAALEQSTQDYRAAALLALQEVEDALVALRGDRLRLERLIGAARSASNAALMASQRYSSGLVDFQTVLETQRTQLSTQDGVAVALADVGSDHVRLYKALGGGWTPETVGDRAATP